MQKMLTLLAAVFVAAPAIAQQSFGLPEGCTGSLTVQSKSCVMINVWQCDNDDPGDQWIALISQGGLFSVQHVDREFQWVEAFKQSGPERLVMPADDPASLDELFANQIDTWDFTLETDDGLERHVGFDMLTGETAEIDGEVLLKTEFQGRTLNEDGVEVEASAGAQYVSETHRLFFFGTAWSEETPDRVIDMSPVEFIYPGEPGFFHKTPLYDCEANLASFTLPAGGDYP